MKIKSIAFDLDDTLLDTTGILVPRASEHAFNILIQAGLRLNLEECEKIRTNMIKTTSHKEVFKHLVEKYGTDLTSSKLDLAIQAFYHPHIPSHLPLLDHALENIKILSKKYTLHIVTAGLLDAQESKINALGIRSYFKKIFVVNSLKNEKKYDAFKKIMLEDNIHAENLLCIGNSLSSEIKDARQIGAWACYFEFGEDRGSINDLSKPTLTPHFHIKHHRELITTCKL